jgi:hypothetical protein
VTEIDPYHRTVRDLSERIVEAQRPIRVLAAINWHDGIKDAFFSSGFKEQPLIDRDYYESIPLMFDPEATREEFRVIKSDIVAELGPVSAAGEMMRFMCDQFRLTLDMLQARGTDQFSSISNVLYGTPNDVFHAGGPTVSDVAAQMRSVLSGLQVQTAGERDRRSITGPEAVGDPPGDGRRLDGARHGRCASRRPDRRRRRRRERLHQDSTGQDVLPEGPGRPRGA